MRDEKGTVLVSTLSKDLYYIISRKYRLLVIIAIIFKTLCAGEGRGGVGVSNPTGSVVRSKGGAKMFGGGGYVSKIRLLFFFILSFHFPFKVQSIV